MNEMVPFAVQNPAACLTDPKTYSEFYRSIKAQLAAFVPDTSTERGRKEIGSMAYKVTRSKTAIDDAGKKLNEEARAQINAVDAQRRKIREELEALATEVRKPLTDWEDAEEARKDAAAADLKKIADLSVVLASDGAAAIKSRWDALNIMIIRDDVHLDGTDHARAKVEEALNALETARARAQKHEDDQRELARLRAEAEERDRADRERAEVKQAAKEAAEREALEKAAYAEAVKRQAEEAERAQKAAAEREAKAVEAARQEAIAKAQREHAAQMAAIEADRKRLADADAARLAEVERTKREEEARQADRAHRSKIMSEAKAAIISLGAEEPLAKTIVLAVIANEIPHVSLRF